MQPQVNKTMTAGVKQHAPIYPYTMPRLSTNPAYRHAITVPN